MPDCLLVNVLHRQDSSSHNQIARLSTNHISELMMLLYTRNNQRVECAKASKSALNEPSTKHTYTTKDAVENAQ